MSGSHTSFAMIQALLPYVAPGMRPLLLQLIFMNQMNALISAYQECLRTCDRSSPIKSSFGMEQIFHELSPFLSREDMERFSQMKDMMEMMQMMQELNTGKDG